jgi:hypothetical protein
VKPERAKLGDNSDAKRRKEHWWKWGRYTPALFAGLSTKDRVLVLSRVGQQGAIAFVPTNIVPAESVVVFTYESDAAFSILQSLAHEVWARFFASSMKDDMRYTPSDCFETFPFPAGWETDAALEAAGREYYKARAALMVHHNEGLTDTYNRFHDRNERDSDILRLREVHAQMDRAVLAAYGWSDLPTACEFIPDYFEEDANGEPIPKSIRYRWPDAVRDEVLARLLKLNAERADEERLSGYAVEAAQEQGKRGKKAGQKHKVVKNQQALPGL